MPPRFRPFLGRRAALAGSAALLAPLLAPGARAQQPAWPSQPLRLVVTFAPGGSTDLIARLAAKGLQERLGQPVIVENRPGAGGTLATNFVAQSAPDGHTMLLSTSTVMAISPALYRNVGYHPMRDFAHVALLTTQPLVFVANKGFPGRTLQDVVRLSQEARDGLDMASSASGSLNHMLIVRFAELTGAKLTHVAFRGAGPAMTAVVGGTVPMMSDSLPSAAAPIRQGSVRAIAISAEARSPTFPDVPTFREQGVDLVTIGWFGIAVPAATPGPVQQRLNRELRAVMAEPEVRARLAESDSQAGDLSVEAFTQMVGEHCAMWPPVVRASGASAD
ncbi:tripartite tricarboxylate transporter substrate binding protein [Siccirubricoccus sp. G192]|uniref:Bug family tripartite tricarboxylate transporter substrate binding protein n=1 Tax=Siccirubricoccus sp. G192 TaxID=2849651 RepID=UPI001C2C9103|nr:tripartite tricarboxylate transporter substrate binding protein [Siccirubricoccus sp. G192]MBV1799957.1 tripartite tricarboxylate transporter substrate binding protein [Siccirubricoccus sp. G192]